MIDEFGNIYKMDNIGDVVQSLEVYNNQLIVLINGDHMIKIYDITENGLTFNREISTNRGFLFKLKELFRMINFFAKYFNYRS